MIDLTGRVAVCICRREEPSSNKLAFFEYLGPGSQNAEERCVCGFFQCAHDPEYMAKNVPSNHKTVVEQGKCTGFRPMDGQEKDHYYCGCRGWE